LEESLHQANPDLAELCHDWQERLRIRNWNVLVARVPALEDWANVSMHREKKNAVLNLRDQAAGLFSPLDNRPIDSDFHDDEETSLVHELLHIVFCECEPRDHDSLEYKAFEFGIHTLAHALVGLKRGT
jgi:hypothetical protein